jgi:hypothetical protein
MLQLQEAGVPKIVWMPRKQKVPEAAAKDRQRECPFADGLGKAETEDARVTDYRGNTLKVRRTRSAEPAMLRREPFGTTNDDHIPSVPPSPRDVEVRSAPLLSGTDSMASFKQRPSRVRRATSADRLERFSGLSSKVSLEETVEELKQQTEVRIRELRTILSQRRSNLEHVLKEQQGHVALDKMSTSASSLRSEFGGSVLSMVVTH